MATECDDLRKAEKWRLQVQENVDFSSRIVAIRFLFPRLLEKFPRKFHRFRIVSKMTLLRGRSDGHGGGGGEGVEGG